MKNNIVCIGGLREAQAENRELIRGVLIDQPTIVKDYATTFTEQKLRTGYRYLLTVIDFVNNIYKINDTVDVNKPNTFGNLKLKDINKYMETIRKRKDGEGDISPEFYNHKRAALCNFFKYLCAEEYVSKNIVKDVAKLKSNKVHEFVYLGQMDNGDVTLDSIRDALDETHENILTDKGKGVSEWGKLRNIAMIDLLVSTGLRCHELIQLDCDSIVFGENNTSHVVVVGKGNKPEVIYFNDYASNSVKTWMEKRKELVGNDNKALFISKGKTRIKEKAVLNIVKKYTGLSPHKLRATAGMIIYITSNGNIEVVAKFLRHSDINTTRRNYVTATRGQMVDNACMAGAVFA